VNQAVGQPNRLGSQLNRAGSRANQTVG